MAPMEVNQAAFTISRHANIQYINIPTETRGERGEGRIRDRNKRETSPGYGGKRKESST